MKNSQFLNEKVLWILKDWKIVMTYKILLTNFYNEYFLVWRKAERENLNSPDVNINMSPNNGNFYTL